MPVIDRPSFLIAGFAAAEPDAAVPELHQVGEQWAPMTYGIPPHDHGGWELYLQVDGRSTWHTAGRRHRLQPGDLYAVPPGVTHAKSRPRRRHHFFYAAFDPGPVIDRHPDLASAWTPADGFLRRRDARDIEPAFRGLADAVAHDQPLRSAAIRAALDLLLIVAGRHLLPEAETHGSRSRPLTAMPAAIARVRQAIETAPAEPWTLETLGHLAGLSPNHLASRFRTFVGESVHTYLIRCRLEAADRLLRTTDLSVTEIALDTGFSSGQHLARAFRRAYACTPTEARRSKR